MTLGDRRALMLIYAVVALLHVMGLWLWVSSLAAHPVLLGLGVAAYALGLRHAFDVDHIVAVDDTVRYLVHRGQHPVGVGFFFSLGHSTVVLLLVAALAGGASHIAGWLPALRAWGGAFGTTVSIVFLLSVGCANLLILRNAGDSPRIDTVPPRGLMSRLLVGPLRRWVSSGWRMYPVGLLFGLGFDTASEVTLLALTAGAAAGGFPVSATLSLPLLFAAAMSAVDTTDGVLMTRAYRWAAGNAARRRGYQRLMTRLSVIAAFATAAFELLGLVGDGGGSVPGTGLLDTDPARLGMGVALLLGLPWIVAMTVSRRRPDDESRVEARAQ